jgi:predicted phage terminase large subunit-like protein
VVLSPAGQLDARGLGVSQLRSAQLLSDYRMTPATLMAKVDQSYIASKWVLYLSYKIAQCISKGSCGLLISAPPRHGKSRLATVATPLWVLERFPQYLTGVVTYGEDLSTDFSREIRDIITQNQNLLSVRLRHDATRVANFLTQSGGGLKSVGLRGTITGRGFNVLVIDDYIKEPKEAESAAYLEGLWTWYRTVARTRLEPGAVIIIVATRWVKNDLHGKLMKLQELTGRNFFDYVTLPALAYEDPPESLPKERWPLGYPDLIGRAPGEPLFPERYTKEDIENLRMEMGSRWFEAMFQQNPHGDEGSVIDINLINTMKKEEYQQLVRDVHNEPNNFVTSSWWDMASTKNAGDYTSRARMILNIKTQETCLDSVVRGQFGPYKAETIFKATSAQDLKMFPRLRVGMEEEPGSSGKYSIRHFQKILDGVDSSVRIVHESAATKGSKLMNAQPYLAHIETGRASILEAGWNQDFLDEFEQFPEGLKDDQVDSSSGAYRLAKNLVGQSPVWGRSAEVAQISREMGLTGRPPASSALTWGV